ncbi:MAG: hypothetical protein Tsb0020_19940 [Haliangiales bacterium]
MTSPDLYRLMRALHASSDFNTAAKALLDMLLDSPPPTNDAKVLRGIVHLRPDDSYRGLVVRSAQPNIGPDLRTSVTAWSWLRETRNALLLVIETGAALTASGSTLPSLGRAAKRAFHSREAILGRDTSHLMALPLRRPGGHIDGFVSLEFSANGAQQAVLALLPKLQLAVDVAAPTLIALPFAPAGVSTGDPELPVIGAAMRPHVEALRLFARGDETLLIQGETGAGKNYLARWCWKQSARAERDFKSISLVAENQGTRAGALFGWKQGAFTGAIKDRPGLIESVQGGTMFIDEIDKLPTDGQAMLLTLLDEGTYHVIGDNRSRQADVRFIIGTNADLAAEVKAGRFLKDLYYRIRAMPVKIPPLRQRRDEIVPWAEYFMQISQQKQRHDTGSLKIEAAAARLLEDYPWPGNLRQLKHVLHRAYMFAVNHASASTPAPVSVQATHVEHAFSYEDDINPNRLLDAMKQAAEVFVSEALTRARPLELDHAKAFMGLVLNNAVERLGERDAFISLGHEKSLKSSNHRKILSREQERVDALQELFDTP